MEGSQYFQYFINIHVEQPNALKILYSATTATMKIYIPRRICIEYSFFHTNFEYRDTTEKIIQLYRLQSTQSLTEDVVGAIVPPVTALDSKFPA